ncbi:MULTISPECIES: FAD/NAD(P)-binding protein [unclassified Neorhizobium]|uniref:FAD/NAD(P)-binding protein n=1 Tax=unclassified Neorhizobium TaxID=2629175 RepID=UPI001FF37961|nr:MULTISPECIES: FAD/NAD(P)-binding protein [unclassified Neorhizobium]MCJ9672405.1 FAD/NAD(P)-binding protein [Neorhizobium sp. SHOUNA12B]MCJ9747426.1 FAD/NAD(P)-binding protein [Neorhizobium sp. SHOUNA12A]
MTYDVAVVGSGFSAIALTINLLRFLPSSASIAVVGDDPGFGRGTAYRTEFYLHRLNVPAARMSVFPDRPDDFVEWLRSQGRAAFPEDFASRGDYGLYLRDTLASLLRPRERRAHVDFIRAKATACVECEQDGIMFHLDNAGELRARTVILALGVGNADLPLPKDRIDPGVGSRIIDNPWRLGWLSRVGRTDELCIFGSGLTMIDQVLSLRAQGHRGRIHVLSRRGLVPHPHPTRRAAPVTPDLPDSREISALLRALRRQVENGADWRGVVDGLRPQTQALWQSLTAEQRSRFLRHALAWWNVHRHRVAPEVFARFNALLRDGTVTVHAGFLRSIERDGDGANVRFRQRGTPDIASFHADWIVNCSGMERAGIGHSPLLTEMRNLGMIAMDELGLGISVDGRSRVLDPDGRPQPGLFAAGALTAGQFWEITAVPDIRVQAKALAETIATDISRTAPRRARIA